MKRDATPLSSSVTAQAHQKFWNNCRKTNGTGQYYNKTRPSKFGPFQYEPRRNQYQPFNVNRMFHSGSQASYHLHTILNRLGSLTMVHLQLKFFYQMCDKPSHNAKGCHSRPSPMPYPQANLLHSGTPVDNG